MIQIAVNGAAGRMGRRIVALLQEQEGCCLACALEMAGHAEVGNDAGLLAGVGELGVPVTETISGTPDVLVDFSVPESAVARAAECAGLGVAVVIGTTGLSEGQVQAIETDVALSVPVLIAPNMSVGVNVLFRLVEEVAAALGEDYDVEIVEMHHRRKKDAPSGTALALARSVCRGHGWDPGEVLSFGRQGMTGERPRRQLAIHAVRGGDVAGDHTVIFAGEGERLELTHRASNRDVFVRGALRAAMFLAGKPPGLYSMKDVLFPE